MDKVIGCGRTYPMDKDLFDGSSYPTVKYNKGLVSKVFRNVFFQWNKCAQYLIAGSWQARVRRVMDARGRLLRTKEVQESHAYARGSIIEYADDVSKFRWFKLRELASYVIIYFIFIST